MLGHDSKKLTRYAYYFLSSQHGIPQSPLSPAVRALCPPPTCFSILIFCSCVLVLPFLCIVFAVIHVRSLKLTCQRLLQSTTKLRELASVDLKSSVPQRVVYALRLLESCTRMDDRDCTFCGRGDCRFVGARPFAISCFTTILRYID